MEALTERPLQLEVPSFYVVAYLVERIASLAKDLVLKARILEEDSDLSLFAIFALFDREVLGSKALEDGLRACLFWYGCRVNTCKETYRFIRVMQLAPTNPGVSPSTP